MPGPTLVNVGVFSAVTATTVTPALPASRVKGNLMVAYARKTGAETGATAGFSVTPPWIIFAKVAVVGNTSRQMILAYAYCTGVTGGSLGDAAPKFTWNTLTTHEAQIAQYTGVVQAIACPSPIGAISTNPNESSTTPATCAAITSTAPNSLAVNLLSDNLSAAPATPASWSSETTNANAQGSNALSDLAIVSTGTSSGSTSVVVTGAQNWSNIIFEILSVAPPQAIMSYPIFIGADSPDPLSSGVPGVSGGSPSGTKKQRRRQLQVLLDLLRRLFGGFGGF